MGETFYCSPFGRCEVQTSVAAISPEELHRLGESLDRLVAIDVNGRGSILPLYAAARRLAGAPLSSSAALVLAGAVSPGRPVLIITGFPMTGPDGESVTETDGPVGAAILALVLRRTLGVAPLLLTAAHLVPCCAAACRAAGLAVGEPEAALAQGRAEAAAAVLALTCDAAAAPGAAAALLDRLQPAAVLAVEMAGPARDGRCYSMGGTPVPEGRVARGDALLAVARQRAIPTLAIGDGGNELGMGGLLDSVTESVPYGERVACGVAADLAVAACISNWGASAVAAALCALAGQPALVRRLPLRRVLAACVAAGAVDGFSARREQREDGVAVSVGCSLLALLHAVVAGTAPEH